MKETAANRRMGQSQFSRLLVYQALARATMKCWNAEREVNYFKPNTYSHSLKAVAEHPRRTSQRKIKNLKQVYFVTTQNSSKHIYSSVHKFIMGLGIHGKGGTSPEQKRGWDMFKPNKCSPKTGRSRFTPLLLQAFMPWYMSTCNSQRRSWRPIARLNFLYSYKVTSSGIWNSSLCKWDILSTLATNNIHSTSSKIK